MNDLTTAFAVPKSEGNAGAEDVSKHSAISRGEIAECGCEVVGRSVRQYCPKASALALPSLFGTAKAVVKSFIG